MKKLWFTMIIILCFTVVTLFTTIGCSKIEKPSNEVSCINAKVENASKYSNIVEVKLMIFDLGSYNYIELARGNWEGDGFTILLPEKIDPNYLQVSDNSGLLNPINDPSSNTTINNKNAKAGTASFCGIDKDGNEVTWFYPIKIDEDGNAKEVFFSYLDADVIISGYDITEAMQDIMDKESKMRFFGLVKTTTIYSLNLKKGWNAWWLLNFVSVAKMRIINEWSTTPISIQKWYSFEDKWELLN